MLPGPTIAAVSLLHQFLLLELDDGAASNPLMDAVDPVARGERHERAQGPGQDQVAGRSGSPKRAAWTASQRSASSGSPRQAAPLPADRSSPLMVSDISTSTRLDLVDGGPASVPTTNSPLDALSATVSVNLMSQSAIRESTISSAGSATSTASRTSVERDLVLGHVDVAAEQEGDLGLDPRLQQRAHRDRAAAVDSAVADVHVVEQVAEVRLVDAELVLHRLRGGADLAADDGRARGEPAPARSPCWTAYAAGEVVGADQVAHRRARHPGRLGLRPGASAAGRDAASWRGHGAILEPVTVLRHDAPRRSSHARRRTTWSSSAPAAPA